MNNRENKAIAFLIALSDVYKDVDDRELDCISPLTIPENGDMSEDIYCMLKAMHAIMIKITSDDDMDLLDTIAMLNRLVYQYSEKSAESEEESNDS